MKASEVISIYTELEFIGVMIWIDGGWAVDALLGEQTREHKDLDLAVEKKDLQALKEYFESNGYKDIKRAAEKMWDLILVRNEHEIEVHAFTRDENGEVVEEPYWDGYSRSSLDGDGEINGYKVRCVSLDQLVKTHDGGKRDLKEKDYKDMAALSARFGIKLI